MTAQKSKDRKAARALVSALLNLPEAEPLPARVWDREGKEAGNVIGSGSPCMMEGCNGLRVLTEWPNGEKTKPCTKGMFTRDDGDYQIG